MNPPDNISGANQLIDVLGFWPTFHDAEVISFSAERALPVQVGHTFARLCVQVRQYAAVGEGTAQYHQALVKNVLIRFLFKDACDFELSGFNHQNVIGSIWVIPHDSALLVEIESIWGFGGSLRCSAAEIEAVDILPNNEN